MLPTALLRAGIMWEDGPHLCQFSFKLFHSLFKSTVFLSY